jgi:hypothetical protein
MRAGRYHYVMYFFFYFPAAGAPSNATLNGITGVLDCQSK